MPTRTTQKPLTLTLEKDRRLQLDRLVSGWSMTQKKFILSSLREYSPPVITPTRTFWHRMRDFLFGKEKRKKEEEQKDIKHLANQDIFDKPNERYRITGMRNPTKALHKIFSMEITGDDKKYLEHVLTKDTDDVYVPPELIEEFRIGHKRHHQKLLLEEKNAPKCPFYLILGPTGSGKSKTINKAIDLAMFSQEVEIKQKVADDLEAILEKHPIMARLDLKAVAPETAERIRKEKRKKKLNRLSKWPILRMFYKEETADILEEEEKEFGMSIDMAQINPNNVQTMWYGETGNKIERAFGPKRGVSIRIFEEAHALFAEHNSLNAQVQEDTLVGTTNAMMDEVEKGERNCMVVMITRKGEEFYDDIYRRFQEKGKIIDMSQYWDNPETIDELVQIECRQQDVDMPDDAEKRAISEKVLDVFHYRGLDVTPAYVRKLIACIAEIKKGVKAEYLEDGVLVRDAFVNVARNLYPKMFKKVYNRMIRDVKWEDYVGDVKEEFQQYANQSLRLNMSAVKGVVLAGAPGTGKTFLAKVYLSRHKEISDVTLKMEDLQDERDPIDGPVKNMAQAFDIAKMCGPTLLFVDEGEAVAMERQGHIGDKITNKFLNAVDGDTELRGVFVVLTTNNPEHLAQAATRSKRLKVMPITGRMNERDIYQLLDNNLKDEELAHDLSRKKIYCVAQQICSTPADYSEFFENIVNAKDEERIVIWYASRLSENDEIKEFIMSNYRAMLGIAESLGFSKEFVKDAKQDVKFLVENKHKLMARIKEAAEKDEYQITAAHLERAREARVKTPRIKGKVTLDDYLQSQLSTEPQVGFVMGAGASETSGTLVPISSSFIYGEDYRGDKVVVTGAVNVNAPQAAELNAAVEMAKHSSKEALTLVMNYLSSLLPEKDVKRIIGTYLKDRHLHHQFLTANYMSGGPSAGMALAINTLSVILDLEVRHDFGITGAPWSRGKTKKDVGSAVIIGGTQNKAQVVLSYLDRMYVPIQNQKEMDILAMEAYWNKGKDVVGYENFPSIIGEVYCWDDETEEQVKTLFKKRIEAKQKDIAGAPDAEGLRKEVDGLSQRVKETAEEVICNRITCIEQYISNGGDDKFASLESIFQKYEGSDKDS